MKKIFFLAGVFALMNVLSVNAQVTIGEKRFPEKFSLLELISSKGQGLRLPQMTTFQRDSITDYAFRTNPLAKGLTFYNTDTNCEEYWNGKEWAILSGEDVPDVKNGLSLNATADTVKWGGNLTENTTITADNKNIVFDLLNIDETKRESGFMVKNLKTQGNSLSVVADAETGKFGLAPSMPAVLAFIQSGSEMNNPSTFNTIGWYVVPWNGNNAIQGGDVVTNNGLVTYKPSEECFVLLQDAMAEISGMVGYIGGGGRSAEMIIVNSTIQIRKAGESVWNDYSSVRGVYTGAASAFRNTLSIPPAMASLKEGDAIRMILSRAPEAPGSSLFLGTDHNTGSGFGRNNGIVRPYGTQFSKMLKIIVQ